MVVTAERLHHESQIIQWESMSTYRVQVHVCIWTHSIMMNSGINGTSCQYFPSQVSHQACHNYHTTTVNCAPETPIQDSYPGTCSEGSCLVILANHSPLKVENC